MKKVYCRGFTFIELMLAAAIFAIVALAIYTTFNSGLTAWGKAQEAQGVYQDIRLTLDRMALDLENAVLYSDKQDAVNFSGQKSSISFFSLVDLYQTIPAYPQLKKITYSLEGSGLKRLEQSYADSDMHSRTEYTDQMAAGLRGLNFSYLYSKQACGAVTYEWRDAWEDSAQIPRGIIIELELGEKQGLALRKFVFIPTGTPGVIK